MESVLDPTVCIVVFCVMFKCIYWFMGQCRHLHYYIFMSSVILLAVIKSIDLSYSKRIDLSCLCCEPLSLNVWRADQPRVTDSHYSLVLWESMRICENEAFFWEMWVLMCSLTMEYCYKVRQCCFLSCPVYMLAVGIECGWCSCGGIISCFSREAKKLFWGTI